MEEKKNNNNIVYCGNAICDMQKICSNYKANCEAHHSFTLEEITMMKLQDRELKIEMTLRDEK